MAITNCSTARSVKYNAFVKNQSPQANQLAGFFPGYAKKHDEYAEASAAATMCASNILFCPDLYQGKSVVDRIPPGQQIPGGSGGDTKKGLKSVDGWMNIGNKWIPYDVKSFDMVTQGISTDECDSYCRSHVNVIFLLYDKHKFPPPTGTTSFPQQNKPDFITCLSELYCIVPAPKVNAYGVNVRMRDYVVNNLPTVGGIFKKNQNQSYDFFGNQYQNLGRFSGKNLLILDVIDQFTSNCF